MNRTVNPIPPLFLPDHGVFYNTNYDEISLVENIR